MPGLFDGIRIGFRGTAVHKSMIEVVGNNIANAANENYSRQQVKLGTVGTTYKGDLPFGQGSQINNIVRIHDDLLEKQLRSSQSSSTIFDSQLRWLGKLEAIYNEPSENGINQALSDFWESWSELSSDPENFSTRTNVIAKTENLTELVRNIEEKLSDFDQEIDQESTQFVGKINSLSKEVAALNEEIFKVEVGRVSEANDLRDQRDASIGELAKQVGFTVREESNGMLSLYVGQNALVYQNTATGLKTRPDPLDASKIQTVWENGSNDFFPTGGEIAGVMEVRNTTIPGIRTDLNSFVSTLITEVNKIYSQGVSPDTKVLMESRLGFESLGVKNTTTALGIVPTGQNGNIHLSFYDSSGDIVRSSGIVIDSADTLADIANKLNNIRGVNASTVSATTDDGKLRLELDTVSGVNSLGEVSFAVSDNVGGYDTSGFLSLAGFSQTSKSTNTSAAAPTLTGVDLSTLQTALGEPDVTSVRSHVLNLAGRFTINGFETGTESTGKTNGQHVQQLSVEVVSTDTIDSIIAKINALTTNFGVSASINGSNQIVVTSSARTDTEGELQLATGTDYLRMSFANTYQFPLVAADEPPSLYNGKGDSTGLLAKMQFNTLLQGSTASDIKLDEFITSADQINTGYIRASGHNTLALDMAGLQHARVALSNQFTLGESYQNLVSEIGTDVQKTENLAKNESLLLQSFLTAKDQNSGVNIDEELANMIIYQRAFDASSRMIRTFNEMIAEFLQTSKG
ncbi:MAG: flagellar hook-associated protein 1 FlgK [Chlamydiales bacterium]|jgi:flagellar hook-associated protein 1 FlgK